MRWIDVPTKEVADTLYDIATGRVLISPLDRESVFAEAARRLWIVAEQERVQAYVEVADANPERVNNGCQIYKAN